MPALRLRCYPSMVIKVQNAPVRGRISFKTQARVENVAKGAAALAVLACKAAWVKVPRGKKAFVPAMRASMVLMSTFSPNFDFSICLTVLM